MPDNLRISAVYTDHMFLLCQYFDIAFTIVNVDISVYFITLVQLVTGLLALCCLIKLRSARICHILVDRFLSHSLHAELRHAVLHSIAILFAVLDLDLMHRRQHNSQLLTLDELR